MPRKAKETERERLTQWKDRVISATKLYDRWSTRFTTHRLEEYYLGNHYSGEAEDVARRKYVINRVYSTMESSKPALLFTNPVVKIEPRPNRLDDRGSTTLAAQGQLCQDTVQTFIDDPTVGFFRNTTLALHEAHFRFGVIEVGYTADWLDNPNVGKPLLAGDSASAPLEDEQGKPVLEPPFVVHHERLFVKRIPASQFRVSLSSLNWLDQNDWVGYWEWHRIKDIQAHPVYGKRPGIRDLKQSSVIADGLRDTTATLSPEETSRRHGCVRVWKLWDLRTKTRVIFADTYEHFLVEDEPFTTQPFAVVKFHEVLDDFYPMPPVFQWISPQDEINDTREMQRVHRRRFIRRYLMRKDTITIPELQKLETGEDGVYAEHTGAPGEMPIQAVPDAPLDASIWRHTAETTTDLREVSGVPGEQTGVIESQTATQANIVNTYGRLRETARRELIAGWLADIARLMLLTIREKMALPFWIKMNADLTEPTAAMEVIRLAATWVQLSAKDLGDMDFEVQIDVASLSPVQEETQRLAWNQVLALLTNVQVLMLLSQSETLMRKTLKLYGIRSEAEVQEIMKIASQLAQVQAMALGAGGGGQGPGVSPMAGPATMGPAPGQVVPQVEAVD